MQNTQANIWIDEPAFTVQSGFRQCDDRQTLQFLLGQSESYRMRVLGISCGRRNLYSVPDFSYFPNLMFLELDENNLRELPGLSKLTKLEVLKVNKNFLTDLSDVEKLTKLVRLDVDFNDLAKLPELGHLKYLRNIHALPNPLQYASSLPPKQQIDDRALEWYEKLAQKMEDLPLYMGQEITYYRRDGADRKRTYVPRGAKTSYQSRNTQKKEDSAEVEQLKATIVELRAEVYNLQQEIAKLRAEKK